MENFDTFNMKNFDIEDFEVYLLWIISILKTQDPQVVYTFKQEATDGLGTENLTNLMIAALQHLVDIDPETFTWALHNYDPGFYVEVRRRTVVAAAQELIRQGFLPGKDFSAMPIGGLVVHPQVKAVLMREASTFGKYVLREILHTFQSV